MKKQSNVVSFKQKACLYDLLSLVSDNRFLTTGERELLQKFIKKTKGAGFDVLNDFGIFRQVEKIILPMQKEFKVTETSLLEFWEPVIIRERKNDRMRPKFFLDTFLGLFDGTTLIAEKENKVDLYVFPRNSITMKDLINQAEIVSIKNDLSPLSVLRIGKEIIMRGLADGVSGTVIFFDTGVSQNDRFLSFLWIHRHDGTYKRLNVNFKIFSVGNKKIAANQVIF